MEILSALAEMTLRPAVLPTPAEVTPETCGSASAGRFAGPNWSGPRPKLPPNSSFSSDFGHFILKIQKNKTPFGLEANGTFRALGGMVSSGSAYESPLARGPRDMT